MFLAVFRILQFGFFSHVKLASNQFDVDNFAFISVLTDSSSKQSSSVLHPRFTKFPTFRFFSCDLLHTENCQPKFAYRTCQFPFLSFFLLLCKRRKRHDARIFRQENLTKTTLLEMIHSVNYTLATLFSFLFNLEDPAKTFVIFI